MTLNEKQSHLFTLLVPYRTDSVMQRIQAYVFEKTGAKMTDYLSSNAPDAEKSDLLDELIEIATNKEWSKLPAVAKGQAETSTTQSEAPAPIKKKPVAVEKEPPSAPASPKSESLDVADPVREAMSTLENLLRQAANAKATPQPQQAPAVTDEHIRKVVREELAKVMRTVADVLQPTKNTD